MHLGIRIYYNTVVHILAQDVSSYIDNCLVCKRFHKARKVPKVPSVLQLLTKPHVFQLISLNFVGPTRVGTATFECMVSIDHASCLMPHNMFLSLSAVDTTLAINFLCNHLSSIFRELQAILVDHGSAFVSHDFVRLYTETLGYHIVYESKFYFQGNASNESSHQKV